MGQTNKPQPYSHDKFTAAIMDTEIAVMESAAINMTTRIFAAAHGLPLSGTIEKKEEASFTEKSLGATILMAGYASDRPAADAIASRLWRNLNGIPEPVAATPAVAAPPPPPPPSPAKADRPTSMSALPATEQVLDPDVLADKTPVFSSAAFMLQVMASLALNNIKRGQRGKIVRDFIFRGRAPADSENRCTIRVESTLQSAVISIYANGAATPLYRTVGYNELWQFAKARDIGALEKIGRGMFANASMRRIEGGREAIDEYAAGVVDADDGSVPSDARDIDDDDGEGDDEEPTIGQLARQAAARTPDGASRLVPRTRKS